MSQENMPEGSLKPELPVFQSRRLYKQIANALEERIRAGVFAPGSYLPSERELALQMGVSRPSVREALIALEVMGLVEVRVGDGVQVCDRRAAEIADAASENSPLEQLQARSLLEGEVAALAAKNATPEQLDALDAALLAMSAALPDLARFQDEDRRFHLAVVEATGNQTLLDLVEYLWKLRYQQVFRKFEEHYVEPREQAAVLDDHRAIAVAIRAGDARKARSAMHQHLDRVRRQFTK